MGTDRFVLAYDQSHDCEAPPWLIRGPANRPARATPGARADPASRTPVVRAPIRADSEATVPVAPVARNQVVLVAVVVPGPVGVPAIETNVQVVPGAAVVHDQAAVPAVETTAQAVPAAAVGHEVVRGAVATDLGAAVAGAETIEMATIGIARRQPAPNSGVALPARVPRRSARFPMTTGRSSRLKK